MIYVQHASLNVLASCFLTLILIRQFQHPHLTFMESENFPSRDNSASSTLHEQEAEVDLGESRLRHGVKPLK
jgi:hypothetical protein